MRNRHLSPAILLFLTALLVIPLHAAVRYVDSTATGANNGTSWADAWTNPNSVSAAVPGDTVYISGGPTGTTRTYNIVSTYGNWELANGTPGTPITYAIGQDSAHNGTAIFTRSASFTGTLGTWIFCPHDVVISGDAKDGQMHFRVTSSSGSGKINGLLNTSGVNNVRMEYVDAGSMSQLSSHNGSTGIHISHCYFNMDDLTAGDRASYASFNGTQYGDNSISFCTIRIPNRGPGIGADGLQWNGSGYDIHDNQIIGYYTAGYTYGQHQDGWQATGNGSKIRIWNNTLIDIGNYGLFAEALSAGYSDVLIYNNLFAITNPAISSGSAYAIVMGVSGGYSGTNCVFNNVVIANNVCVDYGASNPAIALNNVTAKTATFTSCYVTNNIGLNSGGLNTLGNATSTLTNNTLINATNGPSNFVAYTTNGGLANNLHLRATATSLIGKGGDISSLIGSLDRDGMARATPWDIGPYTYGSSIVSLAAPGNARITVSP